MIAHVAFVDCTPEQAEEAARQISADVQPIVRHQQGYGGTAFLADRARERVILVTFWES